MECCLDEIDIPRVVETTTATQPTTNKKRLSLNGTVPSHEFSTIQPKQQLFNDASSANTAMITPRNNQQQQPPQVQPRDDEHLLNQEWSNFCTPAGVTIARPGLGERRRVKSWCSDGAAYGVLRKRRYDRNDYDEYEDDDCEEDDDDDDDGYALRRFGACADEEDDDDDDDDFVEFPLFLSERCVTPRLNYSGEDRKLTASAVALRHGAALCRSQPRLALQRSKVECGDDDGKDIPIPQLRQPTKNRTEQSPATASALALKHGAALWNSPDNTPPLSTAVSQLRRRLVPPSHHAPLQPPEQSLSWQPRRSIANTARRMWSKAATTRANHGGGNHTVASSSVRTRKRKMVYNPWLIPVNHPLKILWDIATVILSIVNAYLTHRFIRERQFQARPGLIEIWYMMDILLNFVTQRTTSDGTVLTSFTAVWARYLTSWFVIDVLALFPGELLYIQPVIELQKKRKFWHKVFRRTKVSIKVTTRILQSGHVPWLYKVLVKARPIRELVSLIKVLIKYLPKYILFVRNMKGVLLIRALRDWGHLRAFWKWTTYTVASSCGGPAVPEDLPPTVAGWTSEEDEAGAGGAGAGGKQNGVEEAWETLNDQDLGDDVLGPEEEYYDEEDDNYSGPF